MAKVEGPLMSIEARGKLADSIVFFPWKGRHVVRQWLKPTQPESTLQGYARAAVFMIGKAIKKIKAVSKGDAVNSKVYAGFTAIAPDGMNWNAEAARLWLDLMQVGGVLKTTAFAAEIAAYSSLGTAELTAFRTNATALGMVDFTFDYGYVTNIEAGCQLYALARAAVAGSIYTTAPYNTALASWVASDINSFKSHITATA
jgi:hypothetical protein